MKKNRKSIFQSLIDRWPYPYVTRDRVSEFSGGLLNPRTLRTLDSQGYGPRDRFHVGRKVAYPVQSLIDYLQDLTEEIK